MGGASSGSAVCPQRAQVMVAMWDLLSNGCRSRSIRYVGVTTVVSPSAFPFPPFPHLAEEKWIRMQNVARDKFAQENTVKDPRYTQLARVLVRHSIDLVPGERVLVEATDI